MYSHPKTGRLSKKCGGFENKRGILKDFLVENSRKQENKYD